MKMEWLDGLGKSKDVSEAIAKAEDAKKNLVKFL
jgi:ribosomal protein S5